MDFENLLNFERASTATYYDSEGVLQTAAVNEPRLDHDPATLEPLGLLVEEERENLAVQSESFSSPWLGGVVSDSSIKAPSGDDFKNIRIEGIGEHQYIVSGLDTESKYTVSCYIKRNTTDIVFVGVGTACEIELNIFTGEIISSGLAIDSNIFEVSNGVYKWEATFIPINSTHGIRPVFSKSASGVDAYCWGFQLEQGGFATSYIPTTGSTATRSPDICSAKSVHPWLDENEGTVYIELDKKSGSYVGNYLTFSDGTTDNQVVIKDRSVFYKETNYMPSPFDPSGWRPDGDGNIANVALDNPSGEAVIGLAEQVGASFFPLNNSTGEPITVIEGDGVVLSILAKNVTESMVLEFYINFYTISDARVKIRVSDGAVLENTNNSTVSWEKVGDDFSLIQVKKVAEGADIVDGRITLFDASSSIPSIGSQLYVQAAFFGKADDWPAVISDTNIIESGTNNLTGTQGFTSALDSGQSKLALSYDGSTYSAAKDGAGFSGTSAGVPALTDLYVGSNGTNRFFNGHIKDVQYYPRKLTESELIELTT